MKVLYHASCVDGAGAALAVHLAFPALDVDKDFIPVQYNSPFPDGLDGQKVVIVDFSYPHDVIVEMARIASSILILDHHKTAEEDLSKPFPNDPELCPIEVVFDMNRSGAMIAWDYFHEGIRPPMLFEYIQDRDLWRFDLSATNQVHTGLKLEMDEWHKWSSYFEKSALTALITVGEGVRRFLDKQVEIIAPNAMMVMNDAGDIIPTYNVNGFLISDLLHRALELFPDAPYARAYFDLRDKRVNSLRSRSGSDVDVSAIAKAHGGGGHKHAAGYTDPLIRPGEVSGHEPE